MPDNAWVEVGSLRIPIDELEWRFSGSGGPGGQHANTANTRVELRFSIEESSALNDYQRERLLERFGPALRVVASDERSQLRNRELALRRLCERIEEALRVRPTRRATRPTRGSKERRLQEKRVRSLQKQLRRDGRDD